MEKDSWNERKREMSLLGKLKAEELFLVLSSLIVSEGNKYFVVDLKRIKPHECKCLVDSLCLLS